MSNLTLRGNVAGTGTFIVESPNSNTSRTLTLPDATTTLVGTDSAQTLTNKTINGGAITLGTSQATTSGTLIDFTGIPSWVKRVTVMFDGVSTNGTSQLLIQLGDSGGIETTGYLAQSVVAQNATTSSGAVYTTGFGIISGAAVNAVSGAFSLYLVSGNSWLLNGGFTIGSAVATTGVSVGTKTLSATLDRIRITTVSGTDTFDAGTINIMWEG